MSKMHLKKGDALPLLAKDTLRLYDMRFCPYCQRTRLVLAHKHIPFEIVKVDLHDKPDWLFEKNPLGKVPVLELNDNIIYDSAICDEYLDEAHPEYPLFPTDPMQKAHIKVLMEHYSSIVVKFYAIRKVSGEEKQAMLNEMHKMFERFEKELNKNNKYFGGDAPNMLDYHMWPWFERIPYLDDLLPRNKLPHLRNWASAMLELPAVKDVAESVKTHQTFLEAYKQGRKPDYDMAPL